MSWLRLQCRVKGWMSCSCSPVKDYRSSFIVLLYYIMLYYIILYFIYWRSLRRYADDMPWYAICCNTCNTCDTCGTCGTRGTCDARDCDGAAMALATLVYHNIYIYIYVAWAKSLDWLAIGTAKSACVHYILNNVDTCYRNVNLNGDLNWQS